ncbi:MAG: acetyl-CoA carboxylase carboxyltransferase subunit beta [bacterium]|jgi:acetyl-CoA carboxylase carboxyl transferase subunit beta
MPDWFRRRPREDQDGANDKSAPAPASVVEAVPEGTFTKCAKCGAILFTKDFERDLKVCAKCGHHHRLTADERIAWTVDEGSFVEFGNDITALDPLGFPEYSRKLELGRSDPNGRNDGLVTGTAQIGGNLCVFGVVDFFYARLAGTMGSVFGEKFMRAADKAITENLPFVLFCASGGARMQEGLLGLMQMAKTGASVAQLAEARIPYICVLTDPTIGGALASYASLGDVIYAEPGANVALAGTRVAQQAQTQKPPANYQTSEFQWEHGFIDKVVPRKEIAITLSRTLTFFAGGIASQTETKASPVLVTPPDSPTAAKRNGAEGGH